MRLAADVCLEYLAGPALHSSAGSARGSLGPHQRTRPPCPAPGQLNGPDGPPRRSGGILQPVDDVLPAAIVGPKLPIEHLEHRHLVRPERITLDRQQAHERCSRTWRSATSASDSRASNMPDLTRKPGSNDAKGEFWGRSSPLRTYALGATLMNAHTGRAWLPPGSLRPLGRSGDGVSRHETKAHWPVGQFRLPFSTSCPRFGGG